MNLVEIPKSEFDVGQFPEGSRNIQGWKGNGFTVIKSIDNIEGKDWLHVSCFGGRLNSCSETVEHLFPNRIFETDGKCNESGVYHFWTEEVREN
jgi:hypothetical protein